MRATGTHVPEMAANNTGRANDGDHFVSFTAVSWHPVYGPLEGCIGFKRHRWRCVHKLVVFREESVN